MGILVRRVKNDSAKFGVNSKNISFLVLTIIVKFWLFILYFFSIFYGNKYYVTQSLRLFTKFKKIKD